LRFATFALRNAKIIVFAVLVLAALGIRSYTIAPEAIFPAMSFARIEVVADAGDLPPDRVRVAVALPLERAFGTLPNVVRVRANAAQGSADVIVDFAASSNVQTDLQYVQSAIADVRAQVTAAKNITATVITPNGEPIVSYAFSSPTLSQAVLRTIVERAVIPACYGTPGLARTLVVGGPSTEYRVDLDAAALAAVGISATDVATALADANNVTAVGSAERYYARYVVVVDAALTDPPTLGAVAIPLKTAGQSVPLSSLGAVTLGVAPLTNQAAADGGRHAVMVNAYALPGTDAVAMARTFATRLAAVRARLPVDVTLTKYWDQTTLVVDSQASLRDAILLGALLAVIVIFLFLRNVRMTLVAAAVIPLAMAIAIFVLERTGQSLNLMSVGGLAVAVGLIIDDAIVIIEGITRTLAAEPDGDRGTVIAGAVGRLALPMAASTATTVVVFIPLALLSGVTGFFFRALASTLSSSLLVSLALALLVAPVLARVLLPKVRRGETGHDGGALTRRYEPILRWSFAHRPIVYLGSACILAATYVLLSRVPNDFLPSLDEGQFEIKFTMPPGTTLAASDAAAQTIEKIVMHDPAVVSEGRLTGIDTNGYTPQQFNTSTLRATLTTGRRDAYPVVSDRIRDTIADAVPAATLDIHQLLEDSINDVTGAPQAIEIAITGPSQQKLEQLAAALADKMAKITGVTDAFNGIVYDDPTLRIAPNASRLAALGITNGDVADALASRTQGAVATSVASDVALIPVRVRVGGLDPTPQGLGGTPIFTRGGTTALGTLANVATTPLASERNDENGQRVIRVTANIEGAALSDVIGPIKALLARSPLPPGYTAVIGGQYQAQQSSFGEFAQVVALAIVLVFAVMLATFGSFRVPLVILTAIPLALIGVALALVVTHTPFNVSSFMGLLLLVGIVVKNGILLVDVANRRTREGMDVLDALVEAGGTRLRPIVMTTLAAIGGLAPLALGIGSGAEMERPLAIAVIGGLSTATLFTLLVIPVLYAAIVGNARRGRAPTTPPGIGPIVATSLLSLAIVVPTATSASVAPIVASAGVPSGTAPDRAPAAPQQAEPSQPRTAFAAFDVVQAQTAGLGSSPDVITARSVVEQNLGLLQEARATYGLSATVGYTQSPQGSPDGTISSRLSTVGFQQTVGDLLAYRPFLAQAESAYRAALLDQATAERTERIRVVGLYYGALKSRALYRARVDALAEANRQLDAAKKRFAAGDAPRLDVVRATVTAAKAAADLANAVATDANATEALGRELGVEGASRFAETAAAAVPAAASLTAEQATAQALAQRSDLHSAEENVVAARAAVTVAERTGVPPVTLSAGYTSGVDGGYHASGVSLSAVATLPVGNVAGGRVAAQRALLAQAVAKRDGVRRSIRLEISSAVRTLRAANEAKTATEVGVVAARAERDATELGYRNGASTSLDVATALATYDQAAVDDLSALYDLVQAQAVLDLEVRG
jgi:CzcA family heavy metal efflux pump